MSGDGRVHVPVVRTGGVEVPLPRYQTEGAVGMDLCAALAEAVTIAPGERRLIPTGYAVAIPVGYEGQVRPRSGLALRHGITVLNAPGTVDPDYRGELSVLLVNLGQEAFVVGRGDRVAQLVICPVAHGELVSVTALDATPRGGGGYGSTGVGGAPERPEGPDETRSDRPGDMSAVAAAGMRRRSGAHNDDG